MKKLFFILSIVVLISCDKKDDPKPVSKLVGTWTGVSSTTEMKIGDKTYKQYLIEDLGLSEEDAEAFNEIVEQMLTLTGVFSEFDVKSDGNWTGHTEYMGQVIDVTGKWTLSGDEKTLTLTNAAQPGVEKHATITTLTDTDLWMEIAPEEIDTPDGITTDFVAKVTAKFTRKK